MSNVLPTETVWALLWTCPSCETSSLAECDLMLTARQSCPMCEESLHLELPLEGPELDLLFDKDPLLN